MIQIFSLCVFVSSAAGNKNMFLIFSHGFFSFPRHVDLEHTLLGDVCLTAEEPPSKQLICYLSHTHTHTLYLQRHSDLAGHLPDDGGGDGGGGVALVAVELDHWTLRGELFTSSQNIL